MTIGENIVIKSSDDWQKIELLIAEKLEVDSNGLLQIYLKGQSKYWNRKEVLTKDFSDIELVEDKEIDYYQIIVSKTEFEELQGCLQNWVDHRNSFAFHFGEYDDNNISFMVDYDERFITDAEKPILHFCLEEPRSSWVWRLPVDATILEKLNNDLKRLLESLP